MKVTKKELRKQEKKRLNLLWKETRLKVLERDKECIICGKGRYSKTKKGLNVHHILEKEFLMFRHLQFDIRNLITACPKCHKFGAFSFHKNPLYALSKLKEKYPKNYSFLLKEVNKLAKEEVVNEKNKERN